MFSFLKRWGVIGVGAIFLVGCQTAEIATPTQLTLPQVAPVSLAPPGRLQIVATTTLVGDIVAQVGGDGIDLTVVMPRGQDPHNYQSSAVELVAVAQADVIFTSGWGLEERLLVDIERSHEDGVIVPISAGIEPRLVNGRPDPHVWLDVSLVRQWVTNVTAILSAADPGRAPLFAANAVAYDAQLVTLDAQLRQMAATLPVGQRQLVTDHDALGYFAEAYGFEVVGTIVPSISSLAEPAAADLTALVETLRQRGVCAFFVESATSARLAATVAGELPDCAQTEVVTLVVATLGEEGSSGDTYISMMSELMQLVVATLAEEGK